MSKLWSLKTACNDVMHEVPFLCYFTLFFNFALLKFTFPCDIHSILSLEFVYEIKHCTLIGTLLFYIFFALPHKLTLKIK